MNKEVIKQWINALKEYQKKPSYFLLRFPLKVESVQGMLYSPEGILCEIHAKQFGKEWLPKEPEAKGKLRSYLTYLGSYEIAPQEVQDWVGMSGGKMSYLRSLNDFDSMNPYIDELERMLL